MASWREDSLPLRVEIVPTGDRAYAEDPESAVLAARWLLLEARRGGAGNPRASFYCRGQLVRGEVGRAEIGA